MVLVYEEWILESLKDHEMCQFFCKNKCYTYLSKPKDSITRMFKWFNNIDVFISKTVVQQIKISRMKYCF